MSRAGGIGQPRLGAMSDPPPSADGSPAVAAGPAAGPGILGGPARIGPPRDRHGHGSRGALALAGDAGDAVPRTMSRRAQFDDLVLRLVDRHLERFAKELAGVEFGIEDVPDIPSDWGEQPVPFGALTSAKADTPTRIVVFRRPVEMRAKTRIERLALVDEVLIEHIAALLGKDPGDLGR